ncbi:GntR family transcriptional regulator [Mesorhizobium waimense]|uniref:GntR family transcriptional regulator n=1 Tax=Mesorhizobium waimense TaxID=1300307 RepID=A0A3A5KJ96_9HYPH|nr:GntR family transcriptional regulator [Mesorhizobium waimense]RJT32676.1 GntR family transcriptional regulator [Mesorhizobium waimense]
MTERDAWKVTRELRDAILRLELRPGRSLDEAALAEALSVSRTPVREAIIQLIADGLVVREGRSAKVAPLDFDDLPKLYDALLIASRMVHRLAAQNRTDDDLKRITEQMELFKDAVASGDGVGRSETNFSFHMAIAKAADNRHFSGFYEQTLIGSIRIARACFVSAANEDENDVRLHLAETVRQHDLIFDAIKAHDAERADEYATLHHNLTKQRIKRIMFSGAPVLNGKLDLAVEWNLP